jgi:hypothetical protein
MELTGYLYIKKAGGASARFFDCHFYGEYMSFFE